MANEKIKNQILEVIENQIKANDPPCTKETFMGLKENGYSETKGKEMMAAILIEEMFVVMKENQAFDEERYCNKLSSLLNK